jgi:hypothetical protein
MREFKIDYIVEAHGLTRSISKTDTDLKPYVESFISALRAKCVQVAPLDYSVEWGALSSTVLASTSTYFHQVSDVWMPSNSFKIVFNPNFQWWNGTCSSKPVSHYDLKSTIMHEVLHGLGYMSTISQDKTAWPSNFDLLLRDSAGELVVSGGKYLGNIGDKVSIEHVRMYNPSTYESGSSFSHEYNGAHLMSHSQTTCHRELEHDTLFILNHLGYQCSLNGTRLSGKSVENPGTFLYIGGVVGVIVIVVIVCIYKSTTGRKRRDFTKEPLLDSVKMNTNRR